MLMMPPNLGNPTGGSPTTAPYTPRIGGDVTQPTSPEQKAQMGQDAAARAGGGMSAPGFQTGGGGGAQFFGHLLRMLGQHGAIQQLRNMGWQPGMGKNNFLQNPGMGQPSGGMLQQPPQPASGGLFGQAPPNMGIDPGFNMGYRPAGPALTPPGGPMPPSGPMPPQGGGMPASLPGFGLYGPQPNPAAGQQGQGGLAQLLAMLLGGRAA